MANVNSLKVKAGKGRSTRDLSFDHVSTIDFNVVKPMGVFELVPGDQLHVRPEIWMRTQALNCPTFGKMDVISRAFFVPMRLCWSNFNDFYRKAPLKTSTGLQYFQHTPRYGMRDLSNAFLNRFVEGDMAQSRVPIDVISGVATRLTFGVYHQGSDPHANMDFSVRHAANCISYRFNPLGKRVYDLFVSLGYRFQFFSDYQGSTNSGTIDNVYSPSLMPILAWLRMFQDWYCPSEFKYLFKPDPLVDVANVTSVHIAEILDELTWACYLFFNDDMFSMCENAPYRKGNNTVDPTGSTFSQQMGMPNSIIPSDAHDSSFSNVQSDGYLGGILRNFDSASSGGVKYSTVNGTNWLGRSPDNLGTAAPTYQKMDPAAASGILNQQVSNWTIKAVMSMATWLQRNNLLSSRVTEYLKAKFGVTPSAARMQVTEYIGSKSSPVKIGDIPCTESQDLAVLGAKGTSYNIDDLRYTAEEFGYVLFTVELRPRIGYGQGVDPVVLRTRLDEFYNEEFDALGFEPVPTHTLVSGPITYSGIMGRSTETANLGASDNRIFGYLPRLWSYKCKHDNLSGDFAVPKYGNSGIQAFHLMRNVDGQDLSGFIHNSLSFRYAGLSYYDNEYARIFNNDELSIGLDDHFHLICSFDAEVNGLPLALNESWQVNQDHNEREGHMTNIQASL